MCAGLQVTVAGGGRRVVQAVEFRNREWVAGRQLSATCAWLRSLRIALIASVSASQALLGA